MAVTMTSEAYGKQPGETYSGPEEAWLITQGYAKNADGADAGTVPDDLAYGSSAIKADGFVHEADGDVLTDVLPADDPTNAANRERPHWPTDQRDATPARDYDFDKGGVDAEAPSADFAVSPASGPAAGGTEFEISGANLTGVTGVTFDGAAATDVEVVNDNLVTGVTPAGTAGPADVVVTDNVGSATEVGAFTYTA